MVFEIIKQTSNALYVLDAHYILKKINKKCTLFYLWFSFYIFFWYVLFGFLVCFVWLVGFFCFLVCFLGGEISLGFLCGFCVGFLCY